MVVVRLELMVNNPWRCARVEDGEGSGNVAMLSNDPSIEQSVKMYQIVMNEFGGRLEALLLTPNTRQQ